MARQDTRNQNTFSRPGKVTYQFEPPSSTVTIILPENSTWSAGLHWHESHVEFLQIVKGQAEVTLDSKTGVWSPDDGLIRIEKFIKHDWKRASDLGGDLIVKEWTDPADGQKEVFFRNISSVLQESTKASGWWTVLQMFVIFSDMDNYPVFSDGPAGGVITHIVLFLARLIGYILGVRSVYPEYTPHQLLKR